MVMILIDFESNCAYTNISFNTLAGSGLGARGLLSGALVAAVTRCAKTGRVGWGWLGNDGGIKAWPR